MENTKAPKIKTKERDTRIENSKEKRKYVYKDFERMRKKIKEKTELTPEQEQEFLHFQAYTVGKCGKRGTILWMN